MKIRLYYLLPLLLVISAGCLKTPESTLPLSGPAGNFAGQFRLLHRSSARNKFDTLKTSLVLNLNLTNNSYSVTGDTAVLHAGSSGNFTISSPYINFTDKTYPKSGIPAKTHLNGIYQYYYDGSVFQLLAFSADTLSFQYDLKKTQ